MSFLLPWLISALSAVAGTSGGLPADLPVRGCEEDFRRSFDAGPQEAGPLRLVQVSCVQLDGGQFGTSEAEVSPSGAWIAQWQGGSPALLEIAPLNGAAAASVPNQVTLRNFASGLGDAWGTAPDALAWRSDSRALWSVRQALNPNGGARSGLRPVSIALDGTIRELPPLLHPAGPLDAVLWAGGRGRALVQFGTNGSYYRPEHADPAPTLAMVDAARGRVLDTVPLLPLGDVRERLRLRSLMIKGAVPAILPDGRMRAVIQFAPWSEPGAGDDDPRHPGFWLLWTQSEPPQEWPAPYRGDFANPLALSRDGSRLLVVRRLDPRGVEIECRAPPCPEGPPPTPVTGPLVELISLPDRRVLWRINATAGQFWSQGSRPKISDDGRYALVALPPGADRRAPVGLIDMRSGRIVQRIAPFFTYQYAQSFGFAAGGRRVWVVSANTLLLYEVARRRAA